jgi:hypothetical protein
LRILGRVGKYKHRILEVTDEQVHCANCGWVRKTIVNGYRPKCSVARREQRHKGRVTKPNPPGWGDLSRARQLHDERRGDHCEVCGSTENLCTDHDHACCPGKFGCDNCIRGTLCRTCNWAEGVIAKMKNAGLLEELLEYMHR